MKRKLDGPALRLLGLIVGLCTSIGLACIVSPRDQYSLPMFACEVPDECTQDFVCIQAPGYPYDVCALRCDTNTPDCGETEFTCQATASGDFCIVPFGTGAGGGGGGSAGSGAGSGNPCLYSDDVSCDGDGECMWDWNLSTCTPDCSQRMNWTDCSAGSTPCGWKTSGGFCQYCSDFSVEITCNGSIGICIWDTPSTSCVPGGA